MPNAQFMDLDLNTEESLLSFLFSKCFQLPVHTWTYNIKKLGVKLYKLIALRDTPG
jgi:hypothetical protein